MAYTTIVAATADDPFVAQYLVPFVGCTIAEGFRDAGHDTLIIYDDLSKHAKIYRDISLLLERAPGRETYPADIFFLHAGLLERAAQLSEKNGGGSLTALPIIQTLEGDFTSYIPTNLISITDGQIYLERELKERGFMPAVNSGLSVSRLGSQVQPEPLKKATGGLRLALAQQRELQKLSRLETAMGEDAQKKMHRGELILELLKQDKGQTVRWEEQVILFHAVDSGAFDELETDRWHDFELFLLDILRSRYRDLLKKIDKEGMSDEVQDEVDTVITDFKGDFLRK